MSAGQESLYPNTSPTYQSIKDWALWLLSVLCVSVMISSDIFGGLFRSKPQLVVDARVERQDPAPMKRSRCANGGVDGDSYDLPLHVAALFIILGTSTIACAFPILATRFPRLHIPASFLFFVSHFGTGVLIATAFVHLLPTAFTSLGDPCLSDFWTKDYPAMPGAIALAGIFFVTVIEMVFSPAQSICRGGNHSITQRRSSLDEDSEEKPVPTIDDSDNPSQPRNQGSYLSGLEAPPHLRDMGPLIGRSSSISRAINRMNEGSEEIVRVASAPEVQTHHETDNGAIQSDVERHEDHSALTPQQKQKKETMQVYLLEMGILFHSVFIGMSLSVSTGKEFVILLIAIVFHRESCHRDEFNQTEKANCAHQKHSKAWRWGRESPRFLGLISSSSHGSCRSHMAARTLTRTHFPSSKILTEGQDSHWTSHRACNPYALQPGFRGRPASGRRDERHLGWSFDLRIARGADVGGFPQ